VPCYHPLHGYYGRSLNPTGKRSIVFKLSRALSAERVSVPCGKCIGCKLERSRQWAVRGVHEVQLHDDNSFITLTYAPEHLPTGGTLIKKHFQDFMKRLRESDEFNGREILYYHCGEYGDELGRPHYHACLFNVDFPDKKHHHDEGDNPLYTSEILSRLWGKGFCTIGDVTYESASYVASYITKRVSPKQDDWHYKVVGPDGAFLDGELLPEYATMSKRRGIGKTFYEKFKHDWFARDFLIVRGKKMPIPKYYDKLYEKEHPVEYSRIKACRQNKAVSQAPDNTFPRRQVKERNLKRKLNRKVRKYEK